MTSSRFDVYKHSGKFGIHGPILALLGAVIAGFPLGFAYSYIIKWIPFIYVNFLATIGYGFVLGLITAFLLSLGKVRNTAVAVMTATLAGLLGLYFEWNGHIHAIFTGAPVLAMPAEMLSGIKQLYENGLWGFRSGGNVTGIVLAVVWVIEAGIIVVLAVLIPYAKISSTPFCEESRCWLDKEKTINTLEVFRDPAQVQALRSGDLGPLLQARPKYIGADVFTRLTLKHSPKCHSFCTAKLDHVTVSIDKDGNSSETTDELTRDLILPHSMFDLLAKFENFQPQSPSAQAQTL